jgi:hypothetical protein
MTVELEEVEVENEVADCIFCEKSYEACTCERANHACIQCGQKPCDCGMPKQHCDTCDNCISLE